MPIFKVYDLEICRDVRKLMRDYGQKERRAIKARLQILHIRFHLS